MFNDTLTPQPVSGKGHYAFCRIPDNLFPDEPQSGNLNTVNTLCILSFAKNFKLLMANTEREPKKPHGVIHSKIKFICFGVVSKTHSNENRNILWFDPDGFNRMGFHLT